MQSLRNNIKTYTAITLVDRLNDSLMSRFSQIENNSIMTTLTILDPRFKKIHFNQAISYSNAVNRIARWMREVDHEIADVLDESRVEEAEETDDNDLRSFHDNLMKP